LLGLYHSLLLLGCLAKFALTSGPGGKLGVGVRHTTSYGGHS
jgi:hypothetical protein